MKLLQDFTDRITDIAHEIIQNEGREAMDREYTIKITPYFRKELSVSWNKQIQCPGSINLNQIRLITGNILTIEVDLHGINSVEEITKESITETETLEESMKFQPSIKGQIWIDEIEKEIDDQIKDLRDWDRESVRTGSNKYLYENFDIICDSADIVKIKQLSVNELWTSVTERFPEKISVKFPLQSFITFDGQEIRILHYDNYLFFDDKDEYIITHWMPLPKQPK